jgi:hypothetical protein
LNVWWGWLIIAPRRATGCREDLKRLTSELPLGSVRGTPERHGASGFVKCVLVKKSIVIALLYPCKAVMLSRSTFCVKNVIREREQWCLCPSFAPFVAAPSTWFFLGSNAAPTGDTIPASCSSEAAPGHVEAKRHRAFPLDAACAKAVVFRVIS